MCVKCLLPIISYYDEIVFSETYKWAEKQHKCDIRAKCLLLTNDNKSTKHMNSTIIGDVWKIGWYEIESSENINVTYKPWTSYLL